MSSDMSNGTQQTSARVKPQGAMMEDYLAKDPETATERLVSQSGDAFKASTNITMTKKLCDMEAYLNQLVQQAQGDSSHRGSSSSSSTL
ncbi:hypothetical protein CHU98_g8359 [Xylaria longipes]|nr:hypothetical protein CHU98_g8359 [Xylaria longipes]